MRLRRWVLVVLAGSVAAASLFVWRYATMDVRRERLLSGLQVGQLVRTDKPTVLLVYSPTNAFACRAALDEWKELERRGIVHVVFVLSEPPSEGDRRSLAIRRVRVDGVLKTNALLPRRPSPRAYLVNAQVKSAELANLDAVPHWRRLIGRLRRI